MWVKHFLAFTVITCIWSQSVWGANVGLLVVATGKYISFVPKLIESAEKHFCTDHNVTYYVFTDGQMEQSENLVVIPHKRLGWPYDTMMRYHAYYNNRDYYQDEDYLFACDADMLFVSSIGDEILGERVATLHPGFVNMRGSYENDKRSLACINEDEGEFYFAGGFYGGTVQEMMKIAKTNSEKIDDDLARGIIAVWHDESHWNRYCIDNPPTVILNPSYCYPENWKIPFDKKLLALDKNHKEMREMDHHK